MNSSLPNAKFQRFPTPKSLMISVSGATKISP